MLRLLKDDPVMNPVLAGLRDVIVNDHRRKQEQISGVDLEGAGAVRIDDAAPLSCQGEDPAVDPFRAVDASGGMVIAEFREAGNAVLCEEFADHKQQNPLCFRPKRPLCFVLE